jgi:type II secretory ATPase GspE/PulE/Tfp pilus assembly ATPase PilB-like protein
MGTLKPTKLGQLLLKKGLLTEPQLAEAMQAQAATDRFLGSILLERQWVAPEQLLPVLAEHYRLPAARLAKELVDPAAVNAVPLKIALHYKVMPLRLANSTLKVAIANPQDVRLTDELRAALQERYTIDPVLAIEEDVDAAIKKYYGVGAETIGELVKEGKGPLRLEAAEEAALEDIEQLASDASVVKLVNQLMLEAHHRRATDIHIEPYRGKVRLRYRIDGVLRNVDVPPAIRQLFPAIISRIKVLS